MSVFDELFAEFPRARVFITHSDSGIWTQVNIPGLPSMMFKSAEGKQVRVDETEYVDLNKEPIEVIQAIIEMAKKDREDRRGC